MPHEPFLFLINTSGALILFIYMIVAFAQIRLRRRLERQGERLQFKMWLFPAASYAVIAGIAFVLLVMAFTPGQLVQLALSTLSAIVILTAFFVRQRLRRR